MEVKSFSIMVLGALYNEWKKIKGYNKRSKREHEGQLQSSFKEFNEKYD